VDRDRFLASLRATFRVEADEHLQAIGRGLQQLERQPSADQRRHLIETVFRAAHSLKGAARAVDLVAIEDYCQHLEDRLARWRRQEQAVAAEEIEQVQRDVDRVALLLGDREGMAGGAAPTPAPPAAVAVTATPTEVEPAATLGVDTVRVAVSRLDAQLLEAEELLGAKLTAAQRGVELAELHQRLGQWRRAWGALQPQLYRWRRAELPGTATATIEVATLRALLGHLDATQDLLLGLEQRLLGLQQAAVRDGDAVGKQIDQLLDNAKRMLLLPVSVIARGLPTVVRELCRDQQKEAGFDLHGGHVELDKRLLEAIKDPLLHLLRNAVVHGIETPDERVRQGKPRRGRIALTVAALGVDRVRLSLADDGAGIDVARIRAAAVEQGLRTAAEVAQLDAAATRRLIFESQLSTRSEANALAGRGLGLAIVRERVEQVGGSIEVDSTAGVGTCFTIVLPTKRAAFRGVVVELDGRRFVLPSQQFERAGRIEPDTVATLRGRQTALDGDRPIPLVRLNDVLGLPGPESAARVGESMLVLGSGEQRVAFVVDDIVDEQELLLKPLQRPLQRLRHVAATTLLGDGQVAAVLDVGALLKSAGTLQARPGGMASAGSSRPRTVLVAEDSITSRLLLKAVLEAAGYRVRTAADGIEAFTVLRTSTVDALVSDVEMPRLDGFALTARVRADRQLRELPVILVTALASAEHRERGIDVGANAYIAKGSFDQSELVALLRRLLPHD
jgi:two-component system, chemotaxis family, sensor kinase CheA